jgi:GDP-L-fucose synthase
MENELVLRGTGKAQRQFLYVDDFAKIITLVLGYPGSALTLICAEPTEYTIETIGQFIANNFGLAGVSYNIDYHDGQLRKQVSTKQFFKLFPDFQFTSLELGINQTIDWFMSEYPKIRF